MKSILFTLTLFVSVPGLSFAQGQMFYVTKEKLQAHENRPQTNREPDMAFRITSLIPKDSKTDLMIFAHSSIRSRVADVRVSSSRIEAAIQLDELGIDYYNYKLTAGEWVKQDEKRVCPLSGNLSLLIAQVDINADGVVIQYLPRAIMERKSTWDNELIAKDHKSAGIPFRSDRYALKAGEFVLVESVKNAANQLDVLPNDEETSNKDQPIKIVPKSPEQQLVINQQAPPNKPPRSSINEPKASSKATRGEDPHSSTLWSIIIVLIVAATCLLWFFLKRRS